MRHHIEIPAFEQGKGFFDVEAMKLVAFAWFEIDRADFDKAHHDYACYKFSLNHARTSPGVPIFMPALSATLGSSRKCL